jgi:hypothetical protein
MEITMTLSQLPLVLWIVLIHILAGMAVWNFLLIRQLRRLAGVLQWLAVANFLLHFKPLAMSWAAYIDRPIRIDIVPSNFVTFGNNQDDSP